MAITKRNTVNKENLTYKKGLLSFKQDWLTYTKKGLLANTKNTLQIATANSCGKFLRQIAMANSCVKFPRQISAADSHGK